VAFNGDGLWSTRSAVRGLICAQLIICGSLLRVLIVQPPSSRNILIYFMRERPSGIGWNYSSPPNGFGSGGRLSTRSRIGNSKFQLSIRLALPMQITYRLRIHGAFFLNALCYDNQFISITRPLCSHSNVSPLLVNVSALLKHPTQLIRLVFKRNYDI